MNHEFDRCEMINDCFCDDLSKPYVLVLIKRCNWVVVEAYCLLSKLTNWAGWRLSGSRWMERGRLHLQRKTSAVSGGRRHWTDRLHSIKVYGQILSNYQYISLYEFNFLILFLKLMFCKNKNRKHLKSTGGTFQPREKPMKTYSVSLRDPNINGVASWAAQASEA